MPREVRDFWPGQRVKMDDGEYLGSGVPIGTLGTVKADPSSPYNVLVRWDDFTDLAGNPVAGDDADDWCMDPNEIAPAARQGGDA